MSDESITVRPLARHDRIIDLPEAVSQVLVCELDGESLGYIYSTVYGWTHSGEVAVSESTPETWAHWQTYEAALDRLLKLIEVLEKNLKQDKNSCPLSEYRRKDTINYADLLVTYMSYVQKHANRCFAESSYPYKFFTPQEWEALQQSAELAKQRIENGLAPYRLPRQNPSN